MKTVSIISLILMIAGALLMFFIRTVLMLVIGLVLILAGILLVICYILGDRQSKGQDFSAGSKTGIHAYTQAEINTLRNDLALVKDIDEKVTLIAHSSITECALAAQDMQNDDLDDDERYRNSHLLVDRHLISNDELNQFRKAHKKQ